MGELQPVFGIPGSDGWPRPCGVEPWSERGMHRAGRGPVLFTEANAGGTLGTLGPKP